MKKIIFQLFTASLLTFISFGATATPSMSIENPNDTVTIQIGKTKKIIIWVKDKKELESLQAYDINKMIADLSDTVDSLGNPQQVLIITEENRNEYSLSYEEGVENDSIDQDWYKTD